jgi:hypothetical protein
MSIELLDIHKSKASNTIGNIRVMMNTAKIKLGKK